MNQPSKNNLALACIVPFAIYLAGSAWLAKLSTQWYSFAYGLVATVSALSVWYLLDRDSRRQLIAPHIRVMPGIAVGLLGIALWIWLSHLHVEQVLATYLPAWMVPADRVGFNPFEQLDGKVAIIVFLVVRTIGIAIVVPIVEELFWRAFLLRWTIDPDWQKISIGTYSAKSCLIVTLLFTLAHPEWLAAATYCLLMNGLLYWKRDVWQTIVAHSISNLSLVVYVLMTDNWWLW
ncbi:MAG: CAAX prenyl protease-related protein [Pirellulales bacterium]